MNRATVLPRIAATAIDGIAALLFLVISALVSEGVDAPARGQDRSMEVMFLILWILYSSTEFVFACTPGKRLLGLRIARQNGREADMGRRFLRWSTKYYSLAPALFDCFVPGTAMAVIGGFMNMIIICGLLGAFNEDRLTWHDEWAGTAVYKRRPVPPPLPALGIHAIPAKF